ncbi:hypothetical protein [Marivirga sp.]|uniref:hypothetical protein n=1 Tax=Marivirga sp. TaxID=2018662 RepID=UPI0025CC809A|nr:hypothetical protein [Marivirga sp.]
MKACLSIYRPDLIANGTILDYRSDGNQGCFQDEILSRQYFGVGIIHDVDIRQTETTAHLPFQLLLKASNRKSPFLMPDIISNVALSPVKIQCLYRPDSSNPQLGDEFLSTDYRLTKDFKISTFIRHIPGNSSFLQSEKIRE